MEKESLIKASNVILEALDKSDINTIDKLELMKNLLTLLNEENYSKDMELLMEHQKSKVK